MVEGVAVELELETQPFLISTPRWAEQSAQRQEPGESTELPARARTGDRKARSMSRIYEALQKAESERESDTAEPVLSPKSTRSPWPTTICPSQRTEAPRAESVSELGRVRLLHATAPLDSFALDLSSIAAKPGRRICAASVAAGARYLRWSSSAACARALRAAGHQADQVDPDQQRHAAGGQKLHRHQSRHQPRSKQKSEGAADRWRYAPIHRAPAARL